MAAAAERMEDEALAITATLLAVITVSPAACG